MSSMIILNNCKILLLGHENNIFDKQLSNSQLQLKKQIHILQNMSEKV